MSDGSDVKVFKALRDTGVRILIGAGMAAGGAIYCVATPEAKPVEAFSTTTINGYVSWWLYIYGPWVLGAVALLLIILAARALKRTAAVDAEGISLNGKPKVAWSEITGLDDSLLGKKGKLLLKRGDGEPMMLNRYHYADFRDLVAFIEDHISVG
jgi:hypothetical protein